MQRRSLVQNGARSIPISIYVYIYIYIYIYKYIDRCIITKSQKASEKMENICFS